MIDGPSHGGSGRLGGFSPSPTARPRPKRSSASSEWRRRWTGWATRGAATSASCSPPSGRTACAAWSCSPARCTPSDRQAAPQRPACRALPHPGSAPVPPRRGPGRHAHARSAHSAAPNRGTDHRRAAPRRPSGLRGDHASIMLNRPDLTRLLLQITAPAVVVAAGEDALWTAENAVAAAGHLPRGQAVTIPAPGTCLPWKRQLRSSAWSPGCGPRPATPHPLPRPARCRAWAPVSEAVSASRPSHSPRRQTDVQVINGKPAATPWPAGTNHAHPGHPCLNQSGPQPPAPQDRVIPRRGSPRRQRTEPG